MMTMTAAALSHRAQDAQSAMRALVESRSLSVREEDPEYPAFVARIAWRIADAMAAERIRRQRGLK